MSRGEAEDLLARLARERVAACLVPMDANEAAPGEPSGRGEGA